jgi:hypothetical protein
MKMSKEDRDKYILTNEGITMSAMAVATGWSTTTVNKARRDMGLLNLREKRIERTILANPDLTNIELAKLLNLSVPKVVSEKVRLGLQQPKKNKYISRVAPSYVYLLHVRDDIYKVGKSKNPQLRLNLLRCNSEEYSEARVVCVVWCADAFGVERKMLDTSDRLVFLEHFDGSTEWVRGDRGELMGRLMNLSIDCEGLARSAMA